MGDADTADEVRAKIRGRGVHCLLRERIRRNWASALPLVALESFVFQHCTTNNRVVLFGIE